MKMKKSVVGLLSAFLVVGASASAFAASEETGNALNQISAKIVTFAEGTKGKKIDGKEMIKKVITK